MDELLACEENDLFCVGIIDERNMSGACPSLVGGNMKNEWLKKACKELRVMPRGPALHRSQEWIVDKQ